MINKKLLNSIKYILVTILAIFCVCSNVKAVVGGLENNEQDVQTTATNGGSVKTGKNTYIPGVSCPSFNVSVLKNASVTSGHKNAKGSYVGPYIENQGNMMYSVVGADPTCSGTYTAFCLDPNFDGVKTGQTLKYKAEPVRMNTKFGQQMYALYKLYQAAGYPKDEFNIFAYQIAARIIAVQPGSGYNSRSNTAKARHNSWLQQYQNLSVQGTAASAGIALAQQAMANANNSTVQNGVDSTLGISLNQVGGIDFNGSDNVLHVNVNVENCQNENCVPTDGSSITVTGGATLKEAGKWDSSRKTMVFTYEVGGLGSDGCINKTLTATLQYSGDTQNAMQISPQSAIYDDRQNYIVFANTNGQTQVTNTLTIDNCRQNQNDNNIDACPIDTALACTEDDRNFVVVNEGSTGGGPTNWEDCIIGKTDVNGNSYDVVNTSKLYRNTSGDSYDRTDAIIGYMSNGSEIKDSDFCVISCKEKYAFILPGNKKEVKQGTYFSFQVNYFREQEERHAVVGISAERTCVSSNMKTNDFNNRVLDLRKQQVDYLNMYLYYKQLYNKMLSPEAMNIYKSNKKSVECNYDDSGAWYEEERDPECYEIVRDNFSNAGYLPAWDGSDVRFSVRTYRLSNENDLNSTLVPEDISTDLSKSFRDKFPRNSRYNFYSNKYSDYAVFDTKFSVDKYISDPYQGYKSRYRLTGYDSRREQSHEECYDGTCWTYYEGWDYYDEIDDYHEAIISNYIDGSEDSSFWNTTNIDDPVYNEYRKSLEKLKNAYQQALAKYEALNAQIGVQADAMQECTNYLDNFSQEANPYRFDPLITFSYPSQSTYMKMLAPNRLENMSDSEPEVNYERFFCSSDPGNPENVFNGSCNDQAASLTKFVFGDLFNDPGDGSIPNVETDVVEYYNVARVGSRATYGRYNDDGTEGCSKSHVSDKGDHGDYCYEFYQSAKQFYTQAPDGVVTTSPSGENKTILSTDGRVYPVAITTPAGEYPFYLKLANIGQFNESSSLGRIMGGGDGKGGTMSGDYGDTEVCYYEVCRVDDPDCGNAVCTDIIKEKCNNGAVSDYQYFSDDDYVACLEALINYEAEDCCNKVDEFKNVRMNGGYAGLIPTSIWDQYKDRCDKTNECQSFTIITSDYNADVSNMSDFADVNNSGSLQVNARAVSLNNLFPNDVKGVNWNTAEAQQTVVTIEQEGEGIFANDCTGSNDPNCHGLDYKVVITADCASAIRQYNLDQEGGGSGNGNGGFNDYTTRIIDARTDAINTGDIQNHSYGATAQMSDEFRQLITDHCSFVGKPAPDVIIDNSSLVIEPWNKN